MLSFENICFLKVGNVDISFKLLSREFHSLMTDGMQEVISSKVIFARSEYSGQSAISAKPLLLDNDIRTKSACNCSNKQNN